MRRPVAGAVLVAAVAAAVAVTAFVVARAGDDAPPRVLLDGSPAKRAPAVLNVESGILAETRVLRSGDAREDVRACFRLAGVSARAGSRLVEVIGVDGRSLTFRAEGTRTLAACEASARAFEPRHGPWCGAAHGRLFAGRLRDGRLDMVNCLDEGRRTVAFGWIEPVRGARWLAARTEETVEVYPIVPGYPVRVTTKDVRSSTSSAVFAVAEYAADGRLLAERRIEMQVAG